MIFIEKGRLRGRLAVWLVEVRAGVYVGQYSRHTRKRIWDQVKTSIENGNGVITWTAQTDAAYAFDTCGRNRRESVDFDGLPLVAFNPESAEP